MKHRKELLILLAFLTVVLASFVSATNNFVCTVESSEANCNAISGGQVVMYLSSSTNAHGELKTSTSHAYNNVLCCNFGSGGTTCTANNEIISLQSTTNSHAERPEGTTYTNKVCYDSLINCFDGTGTNPSSGEALVTTLSSIDNAHIGTSYNTKVICEVNIVTVTPCGNGVLSGNEQCDDNNIANGDGCSSTCTIESGWTCDNSPMPSTCTLVTCGNPSGHIDSGEQCDGGTQCNSQCVCNAGYTSTSPVSTNCVQIPVTCGNSQIDANETCDGGTGCTASCSCGLGYQPQNPVGTACDLIPPPCQITSASWSTSTALKDATVSLNVQATNCNGQSVSFLVVEDDGPGFLADDDVVVTPSNAVISNNVATATWVAEYQNDGIGDPEYLFRATLTTDNTKFADSGLLTVTQSTTVPQCSDVTICGDYGNQNMCSTDPCEVSGSDLSSQISCGTNGVSCSCEWDNTGNLCNSVWSQGSVCGNNIKEDGETCDGTDLGGSGAICSVYGYSGGALGCKAPGTLDVNGNDVGCQGYDFAGCTGFTCDNGGNGIVDVGEVCDGANFSKVSNPSDSWACEDFDEFLVGQGSLDCNNCQITTENCVAPETANSGVGKCLYTQTTNDICEDDGFLTFQWKGAWAWSEACPIGSQCRTDNAAKEILCVQQGSKTVECPAQLALPFFGFYNVIVTIATIGLIYFLLHPKRKTG